MAMYSVQLDNSTRPHETGSWKHSLSVNKGEWSSSFDNTINTLYKNFERVVKTYGTNNFLGTRTCFGGNLSVYKWKNYNDIDILTDMFSSALAYHNIPEKQNIGLFSINREEWIVTEYGCYKQNLVVVPLYDTLDTDSIIYICNQTEMQYIVASPEKTKTLISIRKELKFLVCIIVMGTVDKDLAENTRDINISLVSYDDFLEIGKEYPSDHKPPAPEDLCTICYTSGTTGSVKGAMIQHSAILSMIDSVLMLSANKNFYDFSSKDIHISFLPLAHIFERVVANWMISKGASIGFYHGNIRELMSDMKELKPTVFVSVPRLLTRIYEKTWLEVNNKNILSRFIFHLAYKMKLRNLQHGKVDHWFWDKVVFSMIRKKLGNNINFIFTGSAPVSGDVLSFMRICFSCQVSEGYGQTETVAGTCITDIRDFSVGHVGSPTPANEIKLIDVPKLNYYVSSDPPTGEICVKRDPCCFIGYYKDEVKTRETIDDEGWIHTGDIGLMDGMGRLTLIGRINSIFKLAQGEYVYPDKIENLLNQCPSVEQIFVYGLSIESFVVAIVVLSPSSIVDWAVGKGKVKKVASSNLNETANDILELHRQELTSYMLDTIERFARSKTELKGFEIPKKVYITSEAFSIQNDLLTTSLKLKRHVAISKFSSEIDEMYGKTHTSTSKKAAK